MSCLRLSTSAPAEATGIGDRSALVGHSRAVASLQKRVCIQAPGRLSLLCCIPAPRGGGNGPGPSACFPLVISLPRAQGFPHSQAEKALLSRLTYHTQESTPRRKEFLHRHGGRPNAGHPNIDPLLRGRDTKMPAQVLQPLGEAVAFGRNRCSGFQGQC